MSDQTEPAGALLADVERIQTDGAAAPEAPGETIGETLAAKGQVPEVAPDLVAPAVPPEAVGPEVEGEEPQPAPPAA